MHVTLKARRGGLREKTTLRWLQAFLPEKCRRYEVKLFHYSIQGNHLHLLIQCGDRKSLSKLLRVVSGVVARKVLGAEKGRGKDVGFWGARPYSRVLTWGREFRNVLSYIERNGLEALGKISYVKRTAKLVAPLRAHIQESLILSRFDSLSRQMSLAFHGD